MPDIVAHACGARNRCLCAARNSCRLAAAVTAALVITPGIAATLKAQTTPPRDSASAKATDRPATLGKVTVTDSLIRRRRYSVPAIGSATRTPTLLRDVPQSATVISQALISDQGMRGMADVVRYVPGITMGLGEGHRDAPTIRGNSSTADFFIDGIRDDAQYYRDTYNVERVEALKGPNAMVFGRGGGGGILNRVSKTAEFFPTRTASLTGGSFDQRRATLDVGQRLSSNAAGRINAVYDNAGSYRANVNNERFGINPTATLMLGRSLVKLGYEFYDDQRVVDRGIPAFKGAPASTPIETFFGDPSASQSRLRAQSITATLDRQLWRANHVSDGVHLRNSTRLMTYDKYYQNIFPGAVNATQTSVALNGYNNGTDRRNLFTQTDLTTTLTTSHLRQTLLAGAEFGTQRTSNIRETAYFGAPGSTATSVSVPFDRPTVMAPVTFRQSASDADNGTTVTTQAIYAQDQLAIGSHLQAVVGVRFDRLKVDFQNNRNGEALTRTDNLVSPRVGVVIKPVQTVSIYGTTSVSYLPSSGDQFSSLSATTQTLKPEQFTNREIGAKWDARADLAVTAAVYRLDRTNTTAPDPTTPSRIVQTGEQRTTGWEFGVSGAPTARWQIAGGYANQLARITSRTSAAPVGARPALVPRQTLSLWNRVQLSRALAGGIGVVHQDKMFAAIDNTVSLPSFTRVDAAAFITFSRTLRAQVNVENLLDRQYFPTAHSNNNIMPGAPRLVRIAMHVTP